MANYENAKSEATKVRSDNFLQDIPMLNVEEIVGNYGFKVLAIDFGEKFNNVAGYISVTDMTIYVNKNDSENRKKFTIAHELGHYLLHQEKIKENPEQYAILFRTPLGALNKDPIEKEANCFAANLLVPETLLKKYLESGKSVEELAKIFGVSEDVIGFRMQDLHVSNS